MKNRLLFLLFLLFLISCDSSDQVENRSANLSNQDSVVSHLSGPDPVNDTARIKDFSQFERAFANFQSAVYNEDAAGVNALIDPERGLYIIENPGALPKMTPVKDIRTFKRSFQEQPFFTIKDRLQTCKLKEETLPTFNCNGETDGNTGYSKEGCFADDAAEFRKTELYKYASLPENEVKKIEATLPLVQRTVLQTASSYRFHFGQIKGQWKLLFIDLRIPCSA